jgi:hypothetical protein
MRNFFSIFKYRNRYRYTGSKSGSKCGSHHNIEENGSRDPNTRIRDIYTWKLLKMDPRRTNA